VRRTGSSRSAGFCRSPHRLTTSKRRDRPIQATFLSVRFETRHCAKRSNAFGRRTGPSTERARSGSR
jgi:hypothetical protein